MSPGQIYTAKMSGLAPSTRYYYVFGDGSNGAGGFSTEFSFTTPPLPGPGSSVNLLMTNDMGHYTADAGFEWVGFLSSAWGVGSRV